MFKCYIVALVAFGSLVASAAQASVIYEFTNDIYGSFVYETDNFISENRTVSVADFSYCNSIRSESCGIESIFYVDSSSLHENDNYDKYDAIGFGYERRATVFYYFENGAFSAFGTYENLIGAGGSSTLIIRQGTTIPEPGTAVLEPATWALLIAGLGVMGAGLRRRQALACSAPPDRPQLFYQLILTDVH